MIYIVYKGTLKSGELKIAEPNKCLGYERYKIGEVDENELSNGAKEMIWLSKEEIFNYKHNDPSMRFLKKLGLIE